MIDGPVRLTQAGAAWMRESLGSGHALAKALLTTWDIDLGTTYAIVAPGFPLAGLDTPGSAQGVSGSPDSAELLDIFVEGRLGGAWGLVVVEDPYMRPTDPIFAKFATESVIYEDEVYAWTSSASNDSRGSVGRFIRASGGYPTNAIVLSESRTFPPAGHLTSEDLSAFAKGARMIVVTAYDGEGFIAWLPPNE